MTMPSIFGFLIICLAVWNLTSLLVQEEGPFKMFTRIRFWAGVDIGPDNKLYKRYGINTVQDTIAGAFMCVWCMSRWVAILFILGYLLLPTATMVVSAILAASTVAIMVDNWNSKG